MRLPITDSVKGHIRTYDYKDENTARFLADSNIGTASFKLFKKAYPHKVFDSNPTYRYFLSTFTRFFDIDQWSVTGRGDVYCCPKDLNEHITCNQLRALQHIQTPVQLASQGDSLFTIIGHEIMSSLEKMSNYNILVKPLKND